MTKNLFHLSTFCMLISLFSGFAQQKDSINKLGEVVVVATKFPISKEKIGKVIYQINEKELANMQGKSVIDILNDLASININGANSASGKNKSTYIRGGRDRQVLVLINGTPIQDPTGINSIYDLRFLNTNQIASIEVMNGAASTLYGSGAGTAVINIQLKNASKKPISINYNVGIGTNNNSENQQLNLNDLSQSFAINGTLKKIGYRANISLSKIDGLSEALPSSHSDSFEKDPFLATNSLVQLSYNITKNFTIQLFNLYAKDVYSFDAGPFTDSSVNNGINKQIRYGFASNFSYKIGKLKATVTSDNITRNFHSFNTWTNNTDFYKYQGKSFLIDLVNDLTLLKNMQFITGLNYTKQQNLTNTPYGSIDNKIANYHTIDPYFTGVYTSSFGFNVNAGARLTSHSTYGNHLVYNINPSFNVSKNLKLFSSISTAFIAPSTYQLFSQYGNVNLKPEENKSIEVGFTLSHSNLLSLNTVLFYREEKNTIILPDYITYSNAETMIFARGFDADLKLNPVSNFSLRLGYSFVQKSSDVDYIPKNKFTALIETNALKNTYFSLRYNVIGKRTYFDQWGSGNIINLKSYSLVDFYIKRTILKNRFLVFGLVSNLFNENYIETIGYSTKGRNFKVGFDFNF